MDKLLEIIKKDWDVVYEFLDPQTTLIHLALDIVMKREECTAEQAFDMFVGHETLHLPGVVAFTICEEMGQDAAKVNANMTLQDIFQLEEK